MSAYDHEQIQKLEGLEAVRLRPAMYIGDTGEYGLHHLFRELIDNSIDEVVAGHCSNIDVELHSDNSVSVEDNGRGIPVAIHSKYNISSLELVLCHLHAGGKFEEKAYATSSGLHGVGAKCVVALSKKVIADVWRDGHHWRQEYSRGKPVTKCEKLEKSSKTGTRIQYWPDPEIFASSTETKFDVVKQRVEELAHLNPKIVTINLKEGKKTESFKSERGLPEMLETTIGNKETLGQAFEATGRLGDIQVQVVASYTSKNYDTVIKGYVNNVYTPNGGTHVRGAQLAIVDALTELVGNDIRLKNIGTALTEKDAFESLWMLVAVKVPQPEFEGQTKGKLGNREVRDIVRDMMKDAIKKALSKDQAFQKRLVDKVVDAVLAREAARKARDQARRGGGNERTTLPGKLSDCTSRDTRINEIWIVEGDSAGGSATNGRDRKTQAVLKLRGKIMNTEKSDIHKILQSEQIKNIVDACGLSMRKNEEGKLVLVPNLRYGKIILCTDADVDGSHIACLIICFFYRYCREVIEDGFLYLAKPPLFKLTKGKTVKYALDDAELKEMSKSGGWQVTRFKGLGEMDAQELGDTTMNINNRQLIQLAMTDAIEADRLLDILFGPNASLRKDFIEQHAHTVNVQV